MHIQHVHRQSNHLFFEPSLVFRAVALLENALLKYYIFIFFALYLSLAQKFTALVARVHDQHRQK